VKLLIFGHWSHTGFGTVTRALAERFVAAGHDVRILADNHRGEPVRGPLEGRVWPTMMAPVLGGNLHTNAITGALWQRLDPADRWKPERVLAITDMSGLFGYIGQVTDKTIENWSSVPVFHYCPIEGDNLPPSWAEVWKLVRPVAMSDYGQRVIADLTGQTPPRIYHGVDTDAFHPADFRTPVRYGGHVLLSRDACKEAFGLTGRKIILRVDRNVERKFYDRMLTAFAVIARADPDVTLLLHCDPTDGQGINLPMEIARLPKELHPRIVFTGLHDTWVGLDPEGLCALYNAADLVMSTTGGEGFGLTLAEALACETPVVCSDWAAEREVVGNGGVMVPPLHDSYGEPVRFHSGYGMDWAVPDPKGFEKPVLRLLAKAGERRAYGRAGRLHVQASFSWDTAASEFLSLFEDTNAAAA
jgi:glycosyltransferase involved in cell wall biosynthesis